MNSFSPEIHYGEMNYFISSFLPDGFLYVDDLLAHPQFGSFSVADVERVVASNDKQRFKLRNHPEDGRLQIRANQGHSLQVSVEWAMHDLRCERPGGFCHCSTQQTTAHSVHYEIHFLQGYPDEL